MTSGDEHSSRGTAKFEYLPLTSDHDLIHAYAYAGIVIGHGPEPWVSRVLSDWCADAKAELARRGLLKDAQHGERLL
jgi:hypothetical protein